MKISVQREDFDLSAETKRLYRIAGAGAVASFVGIVRDVRMTLETDDGALVFVRYDGFLDGRADPPVRSAMRFETADPRYAWLGRTVFIGCGTWDGAQVRYEVFEVAA